MYVIDYYFEYDAGTEIDIYPIGDIHLGSEHCDEDAIRAQLQVIANNPNAKWVGMGDYADAITKNDKRFDIGGLAPWVRPDDIIESQRCYITRLFRPIKDKCLLLLTGNHEETIHQSHQDDITRHICNDLGVRYGGYSCFLVLHFKRRNSNSIWRLTIHLWHGAGAAQTDGARLNRLMSLVNDIEADIYLMGHLHAMTQHTPDRLTCSTASRVSSVKLAATITGSWLRAYTQHDDDTGSISYAEKKGYKPSRIGCPVVHIKPITKEFTIEG